MMYFLPSLSKLNNSKDSILSSLLIFKIYLFVFFLVVALEIQHTSLTYYSVPSNIILLLKQ